MQTSPLRGVNFGGWLILEKWMTPSVFAGSDAVDEYTLSQTEAGKAAIKTHRDTFITEDDFIWLRNNGLTAIRLPVGYWMFGGEAPYLSQVSYVDWAMEMANKYEIEVIVDLHGLKGSQNGHEHSGKIGKSEWFSNREYRDESLVTLKRIAERYKDNPQLWGIQIINEPRLGLFHFKLRAYYKRANKLLESILKPHTRIIYSDGFTPRLLNGALRRSPRAVMDAHLYHATKPWTQFVSLNTYYRSLNRQKRFIKRLSKTQPIIVGEWSGSFRQPIFDSFPVAQHGKLVGDHSRRQIESFAHAAGWFYWNYKTEKTGVWHFRSQVDEGFIQL